MAISTGIRDVFGYFQNLNLLALLQDLRDGHTIRQAWLSSTLLCPVAHGLPAGQQVRELAALGQTADLSVGCCYAARHLGAEAEAVERFVLYWDTTASSGCLLAQLEELWAERLADAEAVQQLFDAPSVEEQKTAAL
jgi:hypothetical protein